MRHFIFLLLFITHPAFASVDMSYHNRPEYGFVFNSVGAKYDLDPLLLYAVAITESGIEIQQGKVSPWPFTFRAKDARYYADDLNEAKEALKLFQSKYGKRVDVGMGQINLHWHSHRVPDVESLLDPETNLSIMAEILKETLASSNDLLTGIGRYHSWTEERTQWYGSKIMKIYSNLTAME